MNSNLIYSTTGAILFGIFLRCCTSLHSYSGQNVPPMFGDYEAQRHWMEITYNLPIEEWYFNTTNNDLMYWGLDYPPLTAYHMWICGFIANKINPDYVALNTSRGYESADHKLFMRYTVLIADILIYIPAVCFYYYCVFKFEICSRQNEGKRKSALKKPNKSQLEEYSREDESSALKNQEQRRGKKLKNVTFSNPVSSISEENKKLQTINALQAFILAILYPGLILIDHGHFQYNCVSLGFTILAVSCIIIDQNLLSAFLFTLALNYKQMELYHSLPFFFYFLNLYLVQAQKPVYIRFLKIFQIGLIVLGTFVIIWFPFLFSIKTVFQVLHRLFPLARGVFEDKVANFWCALNVIIKLKTMFNNYQMAKICLLTTLISILPSCIDLFLRGNKNKFILALINCSLGFYLFSFQVHEKSILIVAMSVILYFHQQPFLCFWFLYISCFSMIPLLIKDGLLIAYLSLTTIYLVTYRLMTKRKQLKKYSPPKFGQNQFIRELLITLLNVNDGDKDYTDLVTLSFRHLVMNIKLVKQFCLKTAFVLSYVFSLILVFVMAIFEPPEEFPDIFPLLISLYSFIHLLIFFIYFNYCQLFKTQSTTNIVTKLKKE